MAEQAKIESRDSAALIRRITLAYFKWFVIFGILIMLLGLVPLLTHLMSEQRNRLVFETRAAASQVDVFLTRIQDISSQIASRTHVRLQLQKYNRGQISLERYRVDTPAYLYDAISTNPLVLGLTQVDADGKDVLSIGKTVDKSLWPDGAWSTEQSLVTGPFSTESGEVLVVFAPIVDDKNVRIGTDAITFLADQLHSVLSNYHSSLPDSRIYLAANNGVGIRVFVQGQQTARETLGYDVNYLEQATRSRTAVPGPDMPELFSYGNFPISGKLVALAREEKANWVLAIIYDMRDLYYPVYQQVARLFVIFIIVVLGGIAILLYSLRPLSGKLRTLTNRLEDEVAERVETENQLVTRIEQQAAVAELGRHALMGIEIQDLLNMAVRMTAATLRVELCKVLQLDKTKEVCILRAGTGWDQGLVGNAEVPIDKESQAGYTLTSGQPVIVSDLATESRFSGPQLLIDHGVVSGISVNIGHGEPWGVIGAHSRHFRKFTQNDINFLQSISNCLAEAIARSEAENMLRIGEERYRILFHENPSMLFILDREGTIITVNDSGASKLGYKIDELVGENVHKVIHDADRGLSDQCVEDCFSNSGQIHYWDVRKIRKDGSLLWVRESALVIADYDSKEHVFIVCEDVSEARLLSDQLSYQAAHDQLTGLANRREFELRLARILTGLDQSDDQHAVVYLDLDQFKVVNDTCGHVAGDELLKEIAEVIDKRVRRQDILARLGGDEFAILMQYCTLDQACRVANTILDEMSKFKFEWEHYTFSVSASIGLVPITNVTGGVEEVMRNADSACYVAKEGGRNRIYIYEEHDQDIARWHGDMEWISRINDALNKGDFCLFAQPIVPINARAQASPHHEILIRLVDHADKMILPGAFLPAAERYNLCTRLDMWVIETLFNHLRNNRLLREKLGLCSINLSGQSIANDEFSAFLMEQLQIGLDPTMFCFEITETAAISDLVRARRFIQQLAQLGCTFALDDFGSGLSSFAYLKSLPVHYLKIDGVFVKDIATDTADFAMVKAIHQIGAALGKVTIAEFVENDAIRTILAEIGVDYGQGYVIGYPEMVIQKHQAIKPASESDSELSNPDQENPA